MYDQREHFVSSEKLQSITDKGELKLRLELRAFLQNYEPADRKWLAKEMNRLILPT